MNEVRAKQIRLNSIIQLNDFSIETVDGCREYTIVDAQVVNGLCTNSIISEDLIPPVPADASITEINNQRHNITLLENLNELFRFKLAVVQFRKVYAKNLICEVSLRIAEVRREWRRKMTRVREDFVWAFVASRRRLKLRACAVSIQKMARGLSARRLHLGEVQGRLEEYREFKSVWGEVIEKVREKAPNGPPQISGWAEEREKIDLKHFEDLDDGMVETSGKMADAMSEALKEDPDGEEDTIGLDGEDDDETDLSSPPGSRPSTASSTQPEEIEIDWNQFQITDHVRKYLRTGDKRYRSMFVKKMKQLGKGERSHKLQKPLKGCKSVIYETYLENRTGEVWDVTLSACTFPTNLIYQGGASSGRRSRPSSLSGSLSSTRACRALPSSSTMQRTGLSASNFPRTLYPSSLMTRNWRLKRRTLVRAYCSTLRAMYLLSYMK